MDADELGKLVEIAERDGQFVQNEKRVLRPITQKIKPEEIDAAMQARLANLSRKLGFAG